MEYTYERVQGVRSMPVRRLRFFVDNFKASNGEAIVWVHGNGKSPGGRLDAGEQIDVEAGGWFSTRTASGTALTEWG